jgi:hypothetical protein
MAIAVIHLSLLLRDIYFFLDELIVASENFLDIRNFLV